MTNKTIFYANGDSMVFGTDLDIKNQTHYFDFTEHQRKAGFTGIISDTLKYDEYLNKAIPGGSNERVYRKTVFNISNLLKSYNPEDIFVLIGLSSPLRKEFFLEEYNNWYPFIVSYTPSNSSENLIWNAITSTNSEKGFYTTDFLHILGVQNFLMLNKIPYLITYALGGVYEDDLRKTHLSEHLRNQIYLKRFYSELSFWRFIEERGFSTSSTGHPLEEGHAAWANHLLKYIKENNLMSNEDLK
jgi:hypothetical protein